jgi:hypothetical protein
VQNLVGAASREGLRTGGLVASPHLPGAMSGRGAGSHAAYNRTDENVAHECGCARGCSFCREADCDAEENVVRPSYLARGRAPPLLCSCVL